MRKFFVFAILFCCLFCSQMIRAQQSPDKILKRAAKALGGEAALRKIRATNKSGVVTRTGDGANGNYETNSAQPNLYTEKFELNGLRTAHGFNGKSGWTRDAAGNLRSLTGAASRDFQAEASFRNLRWLDYKKAKAKIASGGQTTINGKKSDAVILTTAKNSQIKLYFDAVSGLPMREEFPAGDTVKIFDYDDFRAVDSVREPFAATVTIGAANYSIKFDRISHNEAVARADFDFPKTINEPLPDIPALLRDVQANEDKVDEILENYTYTQTVTKRETDKTGVQRDTETAVFQITYYKGNELRRLIAKNGKPLPPDEQTKEDEKAQNRVAKIDREIAKKQERDIKQSAKDAPDENGGPRISIADVLRASTLVNPRREIFRSRDMIVFDFEPNPTFDYDDTRSFLKFFGKTAGVIWIDAADKQVARVEAALVDSFKIGGGMLANLKKGASFTLEQERLNNEIWLPSVIDFNVSVKVFFVKGFNFNQTIRAGNYEKFKSEVKGASVDELKKP